MTQTMAGKLLNFADACRKAQRDYFRTMTPESLRFAKACERDLDSVIEAAKEQVRSGVED